jgi:16S rRNA (cytosine967-C5)-methyltransferase
LALRVTTQVRERDAYAHKLIEAQVYTAPLPQPERNFAILLILGVVSCSGELDRIINTALKSPGDIQSDVRDALRISTYELVFLEKDAHAAVDQGVELVRVVAPKAGGLANKVLRQIAVAAQAFPWGDPASDDRALAREQAFPLWLTKRLIADLGRARARDFMRASNTPAPLFAACNPLVASPAHTAAALKALAAEPVVLPALEGEPAPLSPGCYLAKDPARLITSGLLASGKVLACDASAQLVARLATPPADAAFLEVGSGRGTKTVLLQANAQAAWGTQAQLIALDLHGFKADILLKRVKQCGAKKVTAVTGDATRLDEVIAQNDLPALYGGALIDAPCSGIGTLRRHPEIRWRLTQQDVSALAQQGLALLFAVAAHIAPGGFVVYSTCSALREENEQVVEDFLASAQGSGFSVAPISGRVAFRSHLVTGGPDAHFAVKLVRKA